MTQKFKTIGVLGGMGPAAGVAFVRRLLDINSEVAETDQDYAPIILDSNSQIPSRIDALLYDGPSPLPQINLSLKRLKTAGADFAIVICNNSHAYFEDFSHQADLPVIHLIHETVSYLKKVHPDIYSYGLLSTTPTLNLKLYHQAFEVQGVEIVTPDPKHQQMVMEAIYNPQFGIKSTGGHVDKKARALLLKAARHISRHTGAKHIVNGCTEISFALGDRIHRDIHFVDPLTIVARICLQKAGVRI